MEEKAPCIQSNVTSSDAPIGICSVRRASVRQFGKASGSTAKGRDGRGMKARRNGGGPGQHGEAQAGSQPPGDPLTATASVFASHGIDAVDVAAGDWYPNTRCSNRAGAKRFSVAHVARGGEQSARGTPERRLEANLLCSSTGAADDDHGETARAGERPRTYKYVAAGYLEVPCHLLHHHRPCLTLHVYTHHLGKSDVIGAVTYF